ncbi:MAG: hypothetical protein ABR505_00845 [Actinomycetota bacterium]
MTESELDAATEEATSALPAGWSLGRSDHERYLAGSKKLDTYSASAVGPAGEAIIAIALDEAAAYRLLAQRFRGEAEESTGWIPPAVGP